jgi:hypothetical protein
MLLPPLPFSVVLQKSLLSMRRSSMARAASAARVWQNWADLVRAALGTHLLVALAVSADEATSSAGFRAFMLQAALLSLCVLVQTVRFGISPQLVAPIFYLCGVVLALGGPIHGVFAVAVGWLFAIGGKNLAYHLPAAAVSLLAAGAVLGLDTRLLLACGLLLMPLILSWLFRKRLLFAAMVPAPAA